MAHNESNGLSQRGQFWLKHIKQWELSQYSQSRYCRNQEISIPAFRWWKRKLAKETHMCKFEDKSVQESSNSTMFTEIKCPVTNDNRADVGFDIQLPNHITLRLGEHYEPKALSQLLDILVNAC